MTAACSSTSSLLQSFCSHHSHKTPSGSAPRPAMPATEAGVREVEITLYLRDELLAYRMDRRARGLPFGSSDHFFGTATGKRRDPGRFRDRILARAVTHANAGAPSAAWRRCRRSRHTLCGEP